MSDSGRFCWYDLMTTDPEAAQSFYTKLIGWRTQAWEGEQPYTMWSNGEQTLGGVGALPEEARQAGAPPHWLGYVLTPNVDETVKKATGSGANVLVPGTDIPTVGRFAVLSDPQGAAFAVFSPLEKAPGHAGAPNKGEFSWHELATTDPEAAFSFYSSLFGWEKTEAMDMGDAGLYQMYKARGGEFPLGGIFLKPKEMPGPSAWLYYTRVEDVHKSANKVEELGGKILNGPTEVPGGDFIVQCMDPQGAAFALHSTKT